jgi:hypothetical protein
MANLLHEARMSHDKSVTVTFDPTATPPYWISDRAIAMKGEGKITWVRSPESAKWIFKRINLLPSDWKQWVSDEGAKITVHDPHKPTGNQIYTITVVLGGKEYTSPDHRVEFDDPPIIKNEV